MNFILSTSSWQHVSIPEEPSSGLYLCLVDGRLGYLAAMSSAHSPTFPTLHLHHYSFSNPSVASPTSQIMLQPFFRFSYVIGSSLMSPGEPPITLNTQPFRWFTYVTAHSPTLLVATPMSQLILQPFIHISYVTGSSLTSPGEPPMHISYDSYKIFAKYCGRHWQEQGSDWLSQVQFFIPFYSQIPLS